MSVDWQRVRELHGRAAELPPDQRSAFLDRECAGDAELRREVEALLAAHLEDSFLDPPNPVGIPPSPAPLTTFGDFDIVREIGHGGMGVVYLARQRSLHRDVALKVLQGGILADRARVDRFHREAQAVARLQHEHIVAVYCDGHSEHAHWFAMQFIDGHDLREEIDRQRKRQPWEPSLLPGPEQPGHVRAVAELVADIADALQHAHEAGVVHRDVKPQNILLDAQSRTARLADFGLARDEAAGSMTATGLILGTPLYMSPEQMRAIESRVDHRTDIYSLGVVLYEMLTHERPYQGQSADEIRVALRTKEPRPVRRLNPKVPRDLETICHHAMAKDVRQRYATAGGFRDDLRRFLAHEAILARPPGVLMRWRNRLVRNRAVLLSGAALLLSAAIGALWAAARAQQRQYARISLVAMATLPAGDHWASWAPIDPATMSPEPRVSLGRLPVHGSSVPPGFVRLRVEGPGGALQEFTRELVADQDLVLQLPAPAQETSVSTMVRIRGGTLRWPGDPARLPLPLVGAEVEVSDFWLDMTEVSNRQYRAFLKANPGHEPPRHWDRVTTEHDDLPVVHVSWEDARAYAEWVGKRLPTFVEWSWAARGAENRELPWPDAEPGVLRGNASQPPIATWNVTQQTDEYFARAAPVESHPEARTPDGLFHMFGNVAEWTESRIAMRGKDGLDVDPRSRFVAGHAWSDGAKGHTLATYGRRGIGRMDAAASIGFRCARSTPPPR